jgi:hypothetical protein
MKTYTRQEAVDASLQYFSGDKLAADVFVGKYALHNGNSWYELTPQDMHRRLAKEFPLCSAYLPTKTSAASLSPEKYCRDASTASWRVYVFIKAPQELRTVSIADCTA